MSDVPQVPPVVVRDVAVIDARAMHVPDALTLMTGRVHDAAVRMAAAAGRWQALVRAHPALESGDTTRAELDAARAHLCETVGTLAARLRRDGLPPQQMLVVVKDAVRAAAPTAAEVLAARDVMSDAVRCGIDAYYAVA